MRESRTGRENRGTWCDSNTRSSLVIMENHQFIMYHSMKGTIRKHDRDKRHPSCVFDANSQVSCGRRGSPEPNNLVQILHAMLQTRAYYFTRKSLASFSRTLENSRNDERVSVAVLADVAGPGQVPSSPEYTCTNTRLGATSSRGAGIYIPRRVEHEITRNEMTHPPRIISRKRLIKVHGSALDAHEYNSIRLHTSTRVRTRDRTPGRGERYPAVSLRRCMLCFPPRFFISFCPVSLVVRQRTRGEGRSGSAETASARALE